MAIPTSTLGQVYKQALQNNKLYIPGDLDRYKKLYLQTFLDSEAGGTESVSIVEGQQRLSSQTKRELNGTVIFTKGQELVEVVHNMNLHPRRYVVTLGTSSSSVQVLNKTENRFMLKQNNIANPAFVDFTVRELDIAAQEVNANFKTIFSQAAKLYTSTPVAEQGLGSSVSCSFDGNTCVAGSPGDVPGGPGAVYVFTRNPSTNEWTTSARLIANAENVDDLGFSLSLDGSGSVIIAGAPLKNDQGAAYVFEKINNQWSQTKTFTSPTTGVFFGGFVTISNDGNTISVSDVSKTNSSGEVYIYVRNPTSFEWPTDPTHTISLNPSVDNAYFGTSIALSTNGNVIIVGASEIDQKRGNVYVYEKTGSTWVSTQTLSAYDAQPEHYFGVASCLSGDGNRVAVGATGNASIESGSIYVFKRNAFGTSYEAVLTKVKPDDPSIGDKFGSTVALYLGGNGMYVGAYEKPIDGKPKVGASYIFNSTDNGSTWTQVQCLTAPVARAYDQFGTSCPVATSFNAGVVVISAPGDDDKAGNSGAVYVFNGY